MRAAPPEARPVQRARARAPAPRSPASATLSRPSPEAWCSAKPSRSARSLRRARRAHRAGGPPGLRVPGRRGREDPGRILARGLHRGQRVALRPRGLDRGLVGRRARRQARAPGRLRRDRRAPRHGVAHQGRHPRRDHRRRGRGQAARRRAARRPPEPAPDLRDRGGAGSGRRDGGQARLATLREVLARIRSTGGLDRAAQECSRQVSLAQSLIDGNDLADPSGLRALAGLCDERARPARTPSWADLRGVLAQRVQQGLDHVGLELRPGAAAQLLLGLLGRAPRAGRRGRRSSPRRRRRPRGSRPPGGSRRPMMPFG